MKLSFHKYQGTGNDFVIIDNRSGQYTPSKHQIRQICDRRFGIGADGVILLEKHPRYDFYMNYYNADGSKSFCGNGSRCVVRFAKNLGIIQNHAKYEAIDGVHRSEIFNEDVSTEMLPVQQVEEIGQDLFIQTGSPHYIIFVDELDGIDVLKEAHKIRYNARFNDKGTNVNFVQYAKKDLRMRTYERGVENETLSCGTGVTAVAIAHCHRNRLSGKQEINITMPGGVLKVLLNCDNGNYTDIQLIGPAKEVYQGIFNA